MGNLNPHVRYITNKSFKREHLALTCIRLCLRGIRIYPLSIIHAGIDNRQHPDDGRLKLDI